MKTAYRKPSRKVVTVLYFVHKCKHSPVCSAMSTRCADNYGLVNHMQQSQLRDLCCLHT